MLRMEQIHCLFIYFLFFIRRLCFVSLAQSDKKELASVKCAWNYSLIKLCSVSVHDSFNMIDYVVQSVPGY